MCEAAAQSGASLPPRKPARGARFAFTLLELILVLSIIAVASAVATSHLSGSISRSRVESAAQRIIADLERARTRAIAQSRSVTLTFSRLDYAIAGDVRTSNQAMPSTVKLAEAPYYTQIEFVDFDGAASISFDHFGMPSAGGKISIVSGVQSRLISVDAGTGIGGLR